MSASESVHVTRCPSAGEAAGAARWEREIRRRRVPPSAHYASAEQSRLWSKLADAWSPAGEASVREAYGAIFDRVSERLRGRQVQLVALGPGEGHKEADLARRLIAAGVTLRGAVVDISESLVRASGRSLASFCESPVEGLVADLTSAEPPDVDEESAGSQFRLVTAFGVSPNLRPSTFFEVASRFVGDSDAEPAQALALVSANLWPGGETDAASDRVLVQYDNPETRQWLGQWFVEMGYSGDQTADLEFSIDRLDGVRTVRVLATWPGRRALPDGETLPEPLDEWRAGESVELFFSLRYTPGAVEERARAAGLRVIDQHLSSCGREGLFVLARR